MLLRDAIADYLEARRVQNASPKTLASVEQRLEYLSRFLRRRRVVRVTAVAPKDLTDYAMSLSRRGVAHGTKCAYLLTVREFFGWLHERGRLLVDPARYLAIPEEDEAPLPEPPLTEEEVSRILDHLPRRSAVDLRNRLHLELLYGCGLRITESIELKVSDIDLENRCVRIRGKFDKVRVLPLMRGTLGALRDYLALRRSFLRGPDNGVLLLGKTMGKPLSLASLYQYLWTLSKRLGFKRRLHPHLFRHSIAVHLLQRGADIRHVQEFLGHASIDTTKIYLRMVPGRLREDYDKAFPEIAVKTPWL
ncbi:MAG: tyrosine-type recombinase/integrase [Planctomycetes bacterium]|nr:tyrosine-type recombinase/integrase [Planctomycetota bacterium]